MWSVDLPNWHGMPDPEIPDATIWVHTNYLGEEDVAIAKDIYTGRHNLYSVFDLMPEIGCGGIFSEIEGMNIGSFPTQDLALQFALSILEDK